MPKYEHRLSLVGDIMGDFYLKKIFSPVFKFFFYNKRFTRNKELQASRIAFREALLSGALKTESHRAIPSLPVIFQPI